MKISFITATFNRKHLLPNLFESLCNLKGNYDLEWIIVDDGSTDGTSKFLERLSLTSPFTIIYKYKENSGKQASLNVAFKLCNSDISCIIDSDDTIDADTLMELETDISKTCFWDMDTLSTIIYNSKDINGNLIGSLFPINYYVGKPYQYYNQRRIKGDKFDFFKTSILKKYSFPIFDDEKFIAESVVWNLIHQTFDAVFINKSLQIVSYQDTGYSQNTTQLRVDNPKGAIYVNYCGFKLNTSIRRKLRYCINYFRYKFHSRLIGFCTLKISLVSVFFIFPAFIIGFLMYVRDLAHAKN